VGALLSSIILVSLAASWSPLHSNLQLLLRGARAWHLPPAIDPALKRCATLDEGTPEAEEPA
jgi:hypothetical protein